MEEILKYFTSLSEQQIVQFRELYGCYEYWNSRINVISRKDFELIYERHVLHSLAIAKFIQFPDNCNVIDIGTGGGFPGIPLAIMFPNVNFTLCDSIAKKIKVASSVAQSLKLNNVKCVAGRAEALPEWDFQFVVSRAVTSLDKFLPWIKGRNSQAVIYLKGGDLAEEIATACRKCSMKREMFHEYNISQWFKEDFFLKKKIVFIDLGAVFN